MSEATASAVEIMEAWNDVREEFTRTLQSLQDIKREFEKPDMRFALYRNDDKRIQPGLVVIKTNCTGQCQIKHVCRSSQEVAEELAGEVVEFFERRIQDRIASVIKRIQEHDKVITDNRLLEWWTEHTFRSELKDAEKRFLVSVESSGLQREEP